MTRDKNTPNKPRLGINRDFHPSEQPEGTIRFALNAIKESNSGNIMTYQSEPSNKLCVELEEGYKVIGSIYMNDGDKVVFTTNNLNSKILLINSNCESTELVSSECLSFNTSNTILGVYRVRKGCNRTIYWTDHLNEDRWLDLDDLDSFKDGSGNWDCSLFSLTPDLTLPSITVNSVNNSGGNLQPGSYSFAVELLDNNFNVIDKGLFTQYVPIYNDSTSQSFENIYGSLPGSYLADQGGVANTNKSISLTLTNLDTSFTYARVLIIAKISGSGIEQAFISEEYLPITNPTITYTVRSLSDFISEDVNKLRVPKLKYNSSKVIEQVQNRLVRANVYEKVRDYSTYQSSANSIVTQWRRTTTDPEDIKDPYNSKNPLSYVNGTTFIGDEVYAFGIVYVFSDGSFSPVFHIPGRLPFTSDLVELTVIDGPTSGVNVNVKEVEHLGLVVGDTVPKWKVENTYTGVLTGNMAYYQTESTYPLTTDCNGNYIYGALAGNPIRHHKFPDRKSIPVHFNNSSGDPRVNRFGVVFSNINYPDTNIVGHFFVTGVPQDSDKTVVDMGILMGSSRNPLNPSDEETIFLPRIGTYLNLSFDNVYGIRSPKVFTDLNSEIDYIFPLRLYGLIFANTEGVSDIKTYNSGNIDGRGDIYNFIEQGPSITGSRSITNQVLISPNSRYNGVFGKPVINSSYSNKISAVEVNEVLEDANIHFSTVSMKRLRTPYNNIYDIKYRVLSPVLTVGDSQIFYNGGGFITNFNYVDIWRARYSDSSLIEEIFGENTSFSFDIDYKKRIWIETDINYDLIAEGSDCNSKYIYPNSITNYGLTKLAVNDGSNWVLRSNVCNEYYNYNTDYNYTDSNSVFLPLPISYDFCNNCLTKKPNRIIFSPKSFDEEISDLYKITYADDYIELPAHRGEINAIKYKNNKLYVHTDQTTFILQPNPQFISTDQNTAYLNTGDFLSIPPYELMQSDLGYGGVQSKRGYINSDGGYIWVDAKRGKVINLANDLEEVSRNGMYQWFKEYGDSELNKFVKKLTGNNYILFDSPSDDLGIGYSLTYDSRFERILITKKDYIVIESKYAGTVEDSSVNFSGMKPGFSYFDKTSGKFVELLNGVVEEILLSNILYFYGNSWTLSYSFKDKSFVSFHSYLPDLLFSDETYFYSTVANKIYQHLHKDSYGKFNDVQYPYVLEYSVNDYSTDSISSVQYYATFEDSGIKDNSNYTGLIVYNDDQSTGQLQLVNIDEVNNPYENVALSPQQKSVITYDNNSKISNLWDYSTSNRVMSTEPSDISSFLPTFGYIDAVPVNIDYSKSPYESGELRDKYALIRLIYTPDTDSKKVSHRISNTNELQSIR